MRQTDKWHLAYCPSLILKGMDSLSCNCFPTSLYRSLEADPLTSQLQIARGKAIFLGKQEAQKKQLILRVMPSACSPEHGGLDQLQTFHR